MSALLQVRDAEVALSDDRTLVRGISFDVAAGESVALVGESGSGKSVTLKSIMRLHPDDMRVSGSIRFDGLDILTASRSQLVRYRASDVSMIYQDPRLHTDPLQRIGDFLVEGVVAHGLLGRREAEARAIELLHEMGIDDATRRMHQYPHELSGGLLQRVMIAMALMPEPRLLLADEPTTALDVTVQSEVMAIIAEQVERRKLAMLFVTHDLDLAAAVTDRILVMYAGTIVEAGDAAGVYASPRHPYTAGLLNSRPSATHVQRAVPIPGRPKAAFEVDAGCPFADRCRFATELTRTVRPLLRTLDDRDVACHRAEELRAELAGGAA